jgi:ribosomal protein S18 acetylase RimI-like enzyme
MVVSYMLTITQDAFDSSLLGKAVYRVVSAEPLISESELSKTLPKGPGTLTFFFSPFSPPNFEILARANFCLISVRQTYALQSLPPATDQPPHDSPALTRLADVRTQLKPGELTKMAILIGESSRYFKDPRIPKERAVHFYETWLTNSIFGGRANEVVGLFDNQRLAGIATLKDKEDGVIIDLIGVSAAAQGRGVGTRLLHEVFRYAREQRRREVLATTEGENVPANRLYQKQGFLVSEVSFVFHRHT